MALSGRDRGERQWHLMALNGLIVCTNIQQLFGSNLFSTKAFTNDLHSLLHDLEFLDKSN